MRKRWRDLRIKKEHRARRALDACVAGDKKRTKQKRAKATPAKRQSRCANRLDAAAAEHARWQLKEKKTSLGFASMSATLADVRRSEDVFRGVRESRAQARRACLDRAHT